MGILIQGEGPLSRVYAHADFHGKVRGYVNVPQYEPPSYSSVLSLQEAIGGGMLTVVRHQPFQRQPSFPVPRARSQWEHKSVFYRSCY